MIITAKTLRNDYNSVIKDENRTAELDMDFGLLQLVKGQKYSNIQEKERLFLMMKGKVKWNCDGMEAIVERKDILKEKPLALHIPTGAKVEIDGIDQSNEVAVFMAENDYTFKTRILQDEDIVEQTISASKASETSRRQIRIVLDDNNAPFSKLTVGEIIANKGEWSSYPPHYHTQAELYHYRFFPEQGFGYSEQGENVFKVKNYDTAAIPPMVTHPQVAAPGYTMYYIWAIPHIESDRFKDNSRIYSKDHRWVC
jgi:5-deoxy-glucuronate isomerase